MHDGESFRPKNWSEFQHYKDREPPWIKLHRRLLDNSEYFSLSDASAALLPRIWLLAACYQDASIPLRQEILTFRLRWPWEKIVECLKELKTKEFIESASALLASCYQDATPEERQRQRTETEKKKQGAKNAPLILPDWIPRENWDEFLKMRQRIRKPATTFACRQIIAKLGRIRDGGADAAKILDQSTVNAWQDVYPLRQPSREEFNGNAEKEFYEARERARAAKA